MPRKLTNPNATIKEGTQKGTTESESKNFLAKKRRFPQKNANGKPIKRETNVEKKAW